MSKYFYQGFVDDESIVSYKAPSLKSSLSTAYQYLSAANVIIDIIKSSKGCPGNDRFIAPLFLLYINIIELLIKVLLVAGEQSKNIKTHDLKKLFKELHQIDFTEWEKKEQFFTMTYEIIEEFYQHEINYLSTRYIYDKAGEDLSTYTMHEKQFNVSIIELHKDIETIYYYIQEYFEVYGKEIKF